MYRCHHWQYRLRRVMRECYERNMTTNADVLPMTCEVQGDSRDGGSSSATLRLK